MNITVLGASGKTGLQVVRQALEAGHTVHAVVRRADALEPRANLHLTVGDVADPAVVAEASKDSDAIISALGNLKVPLMTPAVQSVIKASDITGVKRFVLMSAFVVERDRLRPSMKVISRLGMKTAIEDKTASEALLRRSGLDWTIAYVTTLTDRPKGARIREVPKSEKLGMRHKISRADSAAWMLDAAVSNKHIHEGIVLAQ
ncbi:MULTISPECIES: NAD(P)-binding oxidoreductase [unclassified Streptomyces]|uniref:NAD(P)-dependent oxidoreductase n=1 Tax=unclassified Streptomyces TaxID=2593676 RepID=UPI0034245778